MPRKRENGFGSFGFKDVGRETYKGKYGSPGSYPGTVAMARPSLEQ